MVLSAEVRREPAPPRESCPFSTAPWAQPAGLHVGRAQQGGWWKADGSEWQRSKVPEPHKVPEGPTKWTSAFEAELAARRAREEAVRFDGCTVYCAKHLYSINDEMCSTCAKKG